MLLIEKSQTTPFLFRGKIVQLFATQWNVAYQAPLFMGFSRILEWVAMPSSRGPELKVSAQNPGMGCLTAWGVLDSDQQLWSGASKMADRLPLTCSKPWWMSLMDCGVIFL